LWVEKKIYLGDPLRLGFKKSLSDQNGKTKESSQAETPRKKSDGGLGVRTLDLSIDHKTGGKDMGG